MAVGARRGGCWGSTCSCFFPTGGSPLGGEVRYLVLGGGDRLAQRHRGVRPRPLENQGGVRNPFGLEEFPWLADAALVILPLLPLCILASTVSLILRYRRSGGEVREQIKWIAFVASLAGLLYLIALLSPFIFFAPKMLGGGGSLPPPLWFELLFLVAVLGFAGVPVAMGFAVLRYRLYDIDVIINRTLVYGSLTALLFAVYFGGVATTQAIFRSPASAAASAGCCGFHPRDRSTVQPLKASHTEHHR
jgi:hypothetical protein